MPPTLQPSHHVSVPIQKHTGVRMTLDIWLEYMPAGNDATITQELRIDFTTCCSTSSSSHTRVHGRLNGEWCLLAALWI